MDQARRARFIRKRWAATWIPQILAGDQCSTMHMTHPTG